MDAHTRRQLLHLSQAFYAAHAEGFDASRGHAPWPGWARLAEALRTRPDAPLRVLDVGCGNARLAAFLDGAGFAIEYTGVDANPALLEAARSRMTPTLARRVRLLEADFLAGPEPVGTRLPAGPFELVALFGVLHHVPGRDWRRALVEALAQRVVEGGLLALAAWQFAGRPRFERRRVAWTELPAVEGSAVDPAKLEPGDGLLRFGGDPSQPPRYCHQLADAELERWLADLSSPGRRFTLEADFRADGSEGDLNRYALLRRTEVARNC